MANQSFLSLLESFRGARVAVLGDFLLDEYIVGTTSRVSREAPIAVVDYRETIYHPGGAANASQNIAAAGATAVAIGVRGADREGETLSTLLAARGVDTEGLAAAEGYATPLKLRIMAGEMNAQKQQVARVDRSLPLALSTETARRVAEAAERSVDACGAVLMSDYGMGLLSGGLVGETIARCRERGVPVVVDSRFRLARFAGATVATPNEVEALEAIGARPGEDVDDDELVARLRERSGVDAFVITRGSQGMLVVEGDGAPTSLGIVGSREATDVTGAGDTVAAFVAMSLACGASVVDAAHMATYAAAVVVMKRGTATASRDEVRALIEHAARS